MMAAVAAADNGKQVCLIEKNEKLGKKLFITGKGRCNVTNAADVETLLANVCTNAKFLYSAFYGYDNRAVMDFLEQAGCPLKTERGERVFPVSDHSSDVIAAFRRELEKRSVDIRLNTEVRKVCEEDGQITGVILQDGKKLPADSVVVCTGGISYPSTGSTGDGYRFAEELGHSVTRTRPALVPFHVREEWCGSLMGLSLKNVSLRLVCGKRQVYEGFGEMLFTHFGISGPLVLSASSFYIPETESLALIDLKPAMDEEQLDKRLLRDFEENKNRQFKNALGGLFPVKLIPVMIALSGIHPDKKVNEISREERKKFVSLIKNLPLTVTGGFNLQIAWSTGHLAGSSL